MRDTTGMQLIEMIFGLVTAGVVATSAVPSTAPASLPPCRTAHVAVVDALSSKTLKPGDAFTFRLLDVDAADPATSASFAVGATGYGVVASSHAARRGGVPGALVLETRFVVAADGSHVPAAIIRSDASEIDGKTKNAPGVLGWLPYVSLVSGSYDALHRGGDAELKPDEKMRIVLGDDAIVGACRVLGEQKAQSRDVPPAQPVVRTR